MNYLDIVKLIEGKPSTGLLTHLREHLDEAKDALKREGAVLFRGFAAEDEEICAEALKLFSSELLEDAFWSTPRTGVAGKTFTATEYPGPRTITLHSEMAYMSTFPRLLAFHSIKVATEGGETTLGPLDMISEDLADLLSSFEPGVLYKRNYHAGVDIPWQKAFRTDHRQQAERVAKKVGMNFSWTGDDSLQTRHVAQGTVKTEDGKLLWFNQSHVFHSSNLNEKDRSALVDLFGSDGLPRDAFFADGKPIPDEVIHHIQSVLEKRTVGVKWQPGDVLIIDNMKVMHGRWPFAGTRKVHVAMAQSQSRAVRTPLFEQKGFGQRLWSHFTG